MSPHEHGVFSIDLDTWSDTSKSGIVCICGHTTDPASSAAEAINRHAQHRVSVTIDFALAQLGALSGRLA